MRTKLKSIVILIIIKLTKKKIKSFPKTYYPIFKQQSISESFNLIKVNKNLKNINIAFNPFNNNNSKNNTNNCDKSNSKSNSINIINSTNNNNLTKVIKEKRLVNLKTSIGNYLNDNACIINEDEKKRNQSLSNKNLIKCNTDHIYYYNNSNVKKKVIIILQIKVAIIVIVAATIILYRSEQIIKMI